MKLELSVKEARAIFNQIQNPEELFETIRVDVKESVGHYLTELMKVELTDFLGRESHERKAGNTNFRNGYYGRSLVLKGLGDVSTQVPRDRKGEFHTSVLPRFSQVEKELKEDLSFLFLTGVSTRCLSLISRRLIGRKLSHTEISKCNQELKAAAEQWRQRDLSDKQWKYLYIDGTHFRMRVSGSIERVPILVVIGVDQQGFKSVLATQSGDKESASNWRELFKDLKGRGLKSQSVQLGIMDGLSGLEKVFQEEFPKAQTQRCQVHVARNVLAKVPAKIKQTVADDLRSIFYASSRKKAKRFFKEFETKWEQQIPSAVKCLKNNLASCLRYHDFPQEDWVSLRTTNVIERLNKEFKRRTKSMEIVAGEESCYLLLAFICIKMEMHWRTTPVGYVKKNLPFFKALEA